MHKGIWFVAGMCGGLVLALALAMIVFVVVVDTPVGGKRHTENIEGR